MYEAAEKAVLRFFPSAVTEAVVPPSATALAEAAAALAKQQSQASFAAARDELDKFMASVAAIIDADADYATAKVWLMSTIRSTYSVSDQYKNLMAAPKHTMKRMVLQHFEKWVTAGSPAGVESSDAPSVQVPGPQAEGAPSGVADSGQGSAVQKNGES
jgi:hypothetical protein